MEAEEYNKILKFLNEGKFNEGIENVRATIDETVHLTCTGIYASGTWRGPDPITKSIRPLPYFTGLQKNPSVNISNVRIDVDKDNRRYNLVIFNFTRHNEGVYECQMPGLSLQSGFSTKRYQVLLESQSRDDLTLYTTKHSTADFFNEVVVSYTFGPPALNRTDANTKVHVDHQVFNPIFGWLTGGLFLFLTCIFIILFCYYKKHCRKQRFQPTTIEAPYDEIGPINNMDSQFLTRQNRIDILDTDGNRSNSIPLYVLPIEENTVQQVITDDRIDNVENGSNRNTEVFSGVTDGYENPYQPLVQNHNSEDHPYCECTINLKIHDVSLNYSEILHEPVPSTRDAVIHGINDTTNYVEIDHSVKVISPTEEKEETSDEDIYENDLTLKKNDSFLEN